MVSPLNKLETAFPDPRMISSIFSVPIKTRQMVLLYRTCSFTLPQTAVCMGGGSRMSPPPPFPRLQKPPPHKTFRCLLAALLEGEDGTASVWEIFFIQLPGAPDGKICEGQLAHALPENSLLRYCTTFVHFPRRVTLHRAETLLSSPCTERKSRGQGVRAGPPQAHRN